MAGCKGLTNLGTHLNEVLKGRQGENIVTRGHYLQDTLVIDTILTVSTVCYICAP